MKVITEAILRDELRADSPEIYYIPEGKILSPAAREYLQQRKIRIAKEQGAAHSPREARRCQPQEKAMSGTPKFVDYETGAFYMEKPEHMTHLHDNALVRKSHPRIIFRGKLDSLQASVVYAQAVIHKAGGGQKLIDDLSDILGVLREIMRCDVLDEEFTDERIIGLTHAELRERSHDPMKFFQIRQMLLPDYGMGEIYAMLNRIRASARETEIAAVQGFTSGSRTGRSDIIQGLNRVSSAMHIIMCRCLAGEYR